MTSKKTNFLKGENKKKIIVSAFLLIFAFTGSYLIYFILQITLNSPTPMVVVVSRSMEPNIHVGDLLFLRGVDAPSQIKEDNVIVYDARGLWPGAPSDPIVHRVIDKYFDGQRWWFLTKGDNNNYPDPAWVPEENVIGVVVGRIPYIGYVKIFLTDSGLLVPLLVILSILLVISIIWDLIKKEEEEEEEVEKELIIKRMERVAFKEKQKHKYLEIKPKKAVMRGEVENGVSKKEKKEYREEEYESETDDFDF
ncbi:MAG: signal peptidase I [Promethearchaeota archaeon]